MMRASFGVLKRVFSVETKIKPKICVIGAGPAGFYAAQRIIKKLEHSEVDIYERLPVPFGLVRFGVAPDHPDVKNVINTFTKTAESPNVRFLGNIVLGTDVFLKDLKQHYHAVLLTYGADESKALNIPGERLQNVIQARRIVGWYNGVPWDSNLDIDLSGESVAIFGQGNVAIDVARILLTPVDELKKTDITQYALDAISKSKIKTIYLIGRRGPLQAAFTIKELREMLKLSDCNTVWRKEDFNGIHAHLSDLSRPKKRITELMLNSLDTKPDSSKRNTFRPVFLRSPLEISGETCVEKVTLGVNTLVGDDIVNKQAVLTKDKEHLISQSVITSIGYKSTKCDPDIPFYDKAGLVQNSQGKVDSGLYVSGWLGTGPVGVILSTMSNAFSVGDLIAKDLMEDKNLENKGGFDAIRDILVKKNKQIVTWHDWLKIDEYEKSEGEKVGKPREKVVDIPKMLEVAS